MFKYKLLKTIYDKSVILFTIIWIISYCVLFSIGDYLSSLIGINKIITLPLGLIISFILFDFLRKYKLLNFYGLKKSNSTPISMLFYVPLFILLLANIWNGVTLNYNILETILYIISMFFVGFLEEIIFRGLLFNEMKKDSLVLAIIVSSITFGMGHIINLLNGSGTDLLNNILQIIYASAAGFMFVMIYLKTDSLIICILFHFLFNALSAFTVESSDILINLFTSGAITIVSLSYGFYLLFTLKNNKKTNKI